MSKDSDDVIPRPRPELILELRRKIYQLDGAVDSLHRYVLNQCFPERRYCCRGPVGYEQGASEAENLLRMADKIQEDVEDIQDRLGDIPAGALEAYCGRGLAQYREDEGLEDGWYTLSPDEDELDHLLSVDVEIEDGRVVDVRSVPE